MRIVSLVPSITEALCMLGLEDSLVEITDYCLHPAPIVSEKHRVGGTKNPRLREVIDARPDLVIVNTDENRRLTFDQLQAAGLNVLVTQTDSLDEVEQAWTHLGEATGTAPAARQNREAIAAARAQNRELLRGVEPLPALVAIWRDPRMASGHGTYMESLLRECGFRNVMESADRKWIRIALHGDDKGDQVAWDVLRSRCGVVLLPSEPYRFEEPDRDPFTAWGISRDRVCLVDGVLLSWWLSRTVEALKYFRMLRLALADGKAEDRRDPKCCNQ